MLLAVALAGCGTFSHYPMGMEQTTLTPLRTGQKTGYEKTFAKRTSGGSGALFAMEMGRTAQLEGDFAASRKAFDQAIAAAQAEDDKSTLTAKGAAAQTGAVLVNDKVIPYRAASFERTLVHHYQTLNYLSSNDVVGAGVEVRRANREQENARRKREKEIAQAKSKEQIGEPGGADDPNLATVYAGLDQAAGAVKFSFQNAATFYLSSVVWEMLGERNDAYIDGKKALEIYPDNPFVQQDVVRLGKRLGMREDLEDFAKRFPAAAETPADGSEALAGKARLVVIYEAGLVPKKTDVTIPYPLPSANSIGMVSLPTYQEISPPAVPAEVTVGGQSRGRTAPICDVGALAARALAEQMPGILTRQLARAVAKGAAANAAERSGGDLAMFAVLMYNLFSEQADLRSWLTLPAHIHIFSAWVEPGVQTVALSATPGGTAWSGEVTFREGKTTVLVVTRIDLAVYSKTIVQP